MKSIHLYWFENVCRLTCVGLLGLVSACGGKDESKNSNNDPATKFLKEPVFAKIAKGLKTVDWKLEPSFKSAVRKRYFSKDKLSEQEEVTQELNNIGLPTKTISKSLGRKLFEADDTAPLLTLRSSEATFDYGSSDYPFAVTKGKTEYKLFSTEKGKESEIQRTTLSETERTYSKDIFVLNQSINTYDLAEVPSMYSLTPATTLSKTDNKETIKSSLNCTDGFCDFIFSYTSYPKEGEPKKTETSLRIKNTLPIAIQTEAYKQTIKDKDYLTYTPKLENGVLTGYTEVTNDSLFGSDDDKAASDSLKTTEECTFSEDGIKACIETSEKNSKVIRTEKTKYQGYLLKYNGKSNLIYIETESTSESTNDSTNSSGTKYKETLTKSIELNSLFLPTKIVAVSDSAPIEGTFDKSKVLTTYKRTETKVYSYNSDTFQVIKGTVTTKNEPTVHGAADEFAKPQEPYTSEEATYSY